MYLFNRHAHWLTLTSRPAGYIGDDHPRELPVQLDLVAMTFENSEHYRISEHFDTWTEWQVLTQSFPQERPAVRLGPQGIANLFSPLLT